MRWIRDCLHEPPLGYNEKGSSCPWIKDVWMCIYHFSPDHERQYLNAEKKQSCLKFLVTAIRIYVKMNVYGFQSIIAALYLLRYWMTFQLFLRNFTGEAILSSSQLELNTCQINQPFLSLYASCTLHCKQYMQQSDNVLWNVSNGRFHYLI